VRRLLVAVAPVRVAGEQRAMHIPCRVAFLPFRFPEPALTLAVKTRLSFAGEDPHRRATYVEPRPWSIPLPPPPGVAVDPVLDDFVPHKPKVEILFSGGIELYRLPSGDGLERHCAVRAMDRTVSFTVSASQAGRVPLRAPWLAIASGGEARLGPAPTPDPDGWLSAGPIDDDGLGPTFEDEFDFSIFQAGNPALAFETVKQPLQLQLTGFFEPGESLMIELPALEPRAVLDWVYPGEAVEELKLVPDTIVVDLDARCVDVVWRGNMVTPERGRFDIDRILVGFASEAEWQKDEGFGCVLRELSRAVFSYAWERHDVRDGVEPPPLPPEDLEMARHEAMSYPVGAQANLRLEEHATIASELLEEREPRLDTLKRHGLDEFAWGLEERALADRLGSVAPGSAAHGGAAHEGAGIHAQWGKVFREAQDRLARPQEDAVIARDYALLAVQMERGDPRKALAEARLSLGSWLRLDRKWQAKMAEDAQVRAAVDELMAAERERLGEPSDPTALEGQSTAEEGALAP